MIRNGCGIKGWEFENEPFEAFCEKYGILHEFSSPRTPQQNGVVERKNRTLQEMARTMIHKQFGKTFLGRSCEYSVLCPE